MAASTTTGTHTHKHTCNHTHTLPGLVLLLWMLHDFLNELRAAGNGAQRDSESVCLCVTQCVFVASGCLREGSGRKSGSLHHLEPCESCSSL